MKKISDILENVDCDIEILGITDDSRLVKEGYLFVATKGFNVDHYDYVDDAIKKGAVFIISDRKLQKDFPHIVVEKDITDVYIECCCKFYDIELEQFKLIGITGTDGKTTTAEIIRQIMDCAYIGTNGVKTKDIKYETANTTPCISELYSYLDIIKRKKENRVVMEVSSEALLHKRVQNFKFNIVGITNITEDHLNIHKTLENYKKCKFKILELLKDEGTVVINGDDKNCREIKYKNLITFGRDEENDYVIKNIRSSNNKVEFVLENEENIIKVVSPLLGIHNIYNVSMAIIICLKAGMNIIEILEKVVNLEVVEGRREVLDFGQEYEIILDYAHTLNGIKAILGSVDEGRKIIVVTGAAGGREKEKRKNIGRLLLEKADLVIFTMDDPRNEDVNKIIDDLIGNSKKENYLRIIDRSEAIEKAISLADKNTTLLILGKGRDNYMAIGNKKISYSDYEVIKGCFLK